MLTSDLDGEEERGRICLENLLSAILSLLSINNPDLTNISSRNLHREVQIVVMRLLSKFFILLFICIDIFSLGSFGGRWNVRFEKEARGNSDLKSDYCGFLNYSIVL